MKTMGVLGGLGPQATMAFEDRVHRVAQRLVPQHANAGYPPMVVYYFRDLPVLMPSDGSIPTQRPPANPALLDAARRLGAWADFLVIPSNGVHAWQPEIEDAAGRPVVSMIDATMAEVGRRGYRCVGVVDFRPPAWCIYTEPLRAAGIRTEVVPAERLLALQEAVHAVDEGRVDPAGRMLVQACMRDLRAQQVDGILLACTELPLLLDPADLGSDVLDPIVYLAEAAVRYAIA
ncbi:MAG TPA: aspartate/glutamate racemase family protein [Herpetosiphonaceae bacterium]|nr:aspartate/glutamate racemase family protein [Herpetosiphonaceae bacterium]